MLDVFFVLPHDKLFTPGPVEVSAKTLAAFSRKMIGHRGDDFKNLYRDIHPKLQRLCGKNAEPRQVEWGKHIDHKDVDLALSSGKFDTVTLVHNETSTGVMNPL